MARIVQLARAPGGSYWIMVSGEGPGQPVYGPLPRERVLDRLTLLGVNRFQSEVLTTYADARQVGPQRLPAKR